MRMEGKVGGLMPSTGGRINWDNLSGKRSTTASHVTPLEMAHCGKRGRLSHEQPASSEGPALRGQF